MAEIHLVLSDDWELRGDGSGNMRAVQFATMRRLREVYEEAGLCGSFNAEVMQQLTHLRLGDKHPELRELASEWEEVVKETYSRGHDVQLHIHPQWISASYDSGRWRLAENWSLPHYPRSDVQEMITTGRDYLETLLRPLNPEYRCVSFRSGSWSAAPSDFFLQVLADLGIVFDMSMADGLMYSTRHLTLDYRDIDEPFLPYYPVMDDARRVAAGPQPIICVPTHTFDLGATGRGLGRLARALRRRTSIGKSLTRYFVTPHDVEVSGGASEASAIYSRREWGQAAAVDGSRKMVSDLSLLSFFQTREMVRDIRTRAEQTRLAPVPIVLGNHSKNIGDFTPIGMFAEHVAAAPDLHVITLSDLARNLQAGEYAVKCQAGPMPQAGAVA